MSLRKKIFGYFLIVLSFILIIIVGLPTIYSSNSGGRLEKIKTIHLDCLKDEHSDIVLLYFGYVGCKTICVPSLTEIDKIYMKLDKNEQQNIKVYFINLLDVIDKELPTLFAHYFNKDFKGVYLDKQELSSISNQFDVVFSKSLSDKYILNHSGYLYILLKDKDKNYYQKYIYTTRPFDIDLIVSDIKHLIQQRGKDEKIVSTHR